MKDEKKLEMMKMKIDKNKGFIYFVIISVGWIILTYMFFYKPLVEIHNRYKIDKILKEVKGIKIIRI